MTAHLWMHFSLLWRAVARHGLWAARIDALQLSLSLSLSFHYCCSIVFIVVALLLSLLQDQGQRELEPIT